jgi:hypothetical protein
MATAICGSDCTITSTDFADATVLGHSFTVDLSSNETDVRAFGSGEYGDWLACGKAGTITVNSYALPAGVAVGDTDLRFTANVVSATIDAENCVCLSQNWNVDAKGVVEFATTIKLTGDATITPVA